jgi:hypothetical protein
MTSPIYIFLLIIIGIILFWLGYFLFFGPLSPLYPYLPWSKKKITVGKLGDPQVCPICFMKLLNGELIKTVAFPSSKGGTDRIMHIKGCYSCLENDLPRKCPICKAKLALDDFLVSRMFDRRFKKNHVHILGCNQCRKA